MKSTTTVVHYLGMSREDPQFKLRMPLELKARIEQAAKDNRRSLNAEIVARLEESFALRSMDAIEAARPEALEHELVDLVTQSHHLTSELHAVQVQLAQAPTDAERSRIFAHASKLQSQIASVEMSRMVKLQQLATLRQRAISEAKE